MKVRAQAPDFHFESCRCARVPTSRAGVRWEACRCWQHLTPSGHHLTPKIHARPRAGRLTGRRSTGDALDGLDFIGVKLEGVDGEVELEVRGVRGAGEGEHAGGER